MKNLTDDTPKCLIELNGKSLLDRQMDSLSAAGVTEIALVTGYKRELLTGIGLSQFYNSRWADTQMVFSLACASNWLRTSPCIVSYSDIFYDVAAVRSLIESAEDISITYDPNWVELWTDRFGDPLLDAETFRLKGDGSLAEIGNKPNSVGEIEGQYMGLLKFIPSGWRALEDALGELPSAKRDVIQMTEALQLLIELKGFRIAAIPIKGRWGEVDSITDLESYEKN